MSTHNFNEQEIQEYKQVFLLFDKNDDGTISFVTIDPGAGGFQFVESKREDKRALIVREGQHEYIFTEVL